MRVLLRLIITVTLAGLSGVALVRWAPGFGVDERELDPRFDAPAIEAMRKAGSESAWTLIGRSAAAVARGDFGTSETFGMPVSKLIGERWAVTAVSVAEGLAAAWFAALLWAGAGALYRPLDITGSVASFALLSLPSGLVAVSMFMAGAPVSAGIGLVLFPQIHRYARQLVLAAMAQPCVIAAAARGVGRWTVLARHAGALAGPQLIPLLGTSIAAGLGAAIPMETLCDSPGIGQLAFKACMSRDLALLLPLILVITLVVQLANAAAEWAGRSTHGPVTA